MITLNHKRWFKTLITLILVFLLILLIKAADFIFNPIFQYVGAVAFPIIGAGLLFYITRPLMHLLERLKLHRILAIIGVFITLIIALFIISRYILPIIQNQFSNLVNNIPGWLSATEEIIDHWQTNQNSTPPKVNQTINNITSNLNSYIESTMPFIFSFIGESISIVFALSQIPFFLFFMLKDGERFVPFITRFYQTREQAISVCFCIKS